MTPLNPFWMQAGLIPDHKRDDSKKRVSDKHKADQGLFERVGQLFGKVQGVDAGQYDRGCKVRQRLAFLCRGPAYEAPKKMIRPGWSPVARFDLSKGVMKLRADGFVMEKDQKYRFKTRGRCVK